MLEFQDQATHSESSEHLSEQEAILSGVPGLLPRLMMVRSLGTVLSSEHLLEAAIVEDMVVAVVVGSSPRVQVDL